MSDYLTLLEAPTEPWLPTLRDAPTLSEGLLPADLEMPTPRLRFPRPEAHPASSPTASTISK